MRITHLRTIALDVAYPNRPTAYPVGMLSKPAPNKARIHFHNATIGRVQVTYFVAFGAYNVTLKYCGKAIVKVAVSL